MARRTIRTKRKIARSRLPLQQQLGLDTEGRYFNLREREFRFYKRARRWEEENLARFLRYAGGRGSTESLPTHALERVFVLRYPCGGTRFCASGTCGSMSLRSEGTSSNGESPGS